MKQISKEIESWIKPYVTIIGDSIEVDKELKELNPVKYFLQLTIPNKFEKYAFALHSFWINQNVPKNEIKENEHKEDELPEEDFTRIKWKDFYEFKKITFDFNQAILSSVNWAMKFTQMNNELYPGEGLMDREHLKSLAEIIQNIYGDDEIEVFYHFLSTTDWEENKMFEGKISELMDLLENKELNFTPSLIYPKNRKWVINTDYDLSFSTIGGEAKLINKLVEYNLNEIYEVEY